jgi:hydrogenase nickel incorporation protein HypA/HybF
MHELSIAQALVEQVEAAAKKEHALHVVRVVIAVGALSGVDAESLRALFPLVAEGTVADGAELVVEPVAARVKCRACGHEAQTDEAFFIGCAACGSRDVEVSAGRELNIRTVELETDER